MIEPRRARRKIAEDRKTDPVVDLVTALRSLVQEAKVNWAGYEKEKRCARTGSALITATGA